jgi:hypothetical protein
MIRRLINFRLLSLSAVALLPTPYLSAQTFHPLIAAGEARPSYKNADVPVPSWSGGVLVPIENNGSPTPVIRSFTDGGAELPAIVFSIPESVRIRIEGLARSSEGVYALCGRAYDRDDKGGGFVSWVSADNQHKTIVQVYPYSPHEITVTPDGSTWTQGLDVVAGADWMGSTNGIIRRFDRSGKLIGSFIPRSSVLPDVDTVSIVQGKLASNEDHVGWYANHAHAYFELTFKGEIVSGPEAYPGIGAHGDDSSRVTGLAFLNSGEVYISAQHDDQSPSEQIYLLDRTARRWIPVRLPSSSDGTPFAIPFILGSDGEKLALSGEEYSVRFVRPKN